MEGNERICPKHPIYKAGYDAGFKDGELHCLEELKPIASMEREMTVERCGCGWAPELKDEQVHYASDEREFQLVCANPQCAVKIPWQKSLEAAVEVWNLAMSKEPDPMDNMSLEDALLNIDALAFALKYNKGDDFSSWMLRECLNAIRGHLGEEG